MYSVEFCAVYQIVSTQRSNRLEAFGHVSAALLQAPHEYWHEYRIAYIIHGIRCEEDKSARILHSCCVSMPFEVDMMPSTSSVKRDRSLNCTVG
jgi:hypothetical protein